MNTEISKELISRLDGSSASECTAGYEILYEDWGYTTREYEEPLPPSGMMYVAKRDYIRCLFELTEQELEYVLSQDVVSLFSTSLMPRQLGWWHLKLPCRGVLQLFDVMPVRHESVFTFLTFITGTIVDRSSFNSILSTLSSAEKDAVSHILTTHFLRDHTPELFRDAIKAGVKIRMTCSDIPNIFRQWNRSDISIYNYMMLMTGNERHDDLADQLLKLKYDDKLMAVRIMLEYHGVSFILNPENVSESFRLNVDDVVSLINSVVPDMMPDINVYMKLLTGDGSCDHLKQRILALTDIEKAHAIDVIARSQTVDLSKWFAVCELPQAAPAVYDFIVETMTTPSHACNVELPGLIKASSLELKNLIAANKSLFTNFLDHDKSVEPYVIVLSLVFPESADAVSYLLGRMITADNSDVDLAVSRIINIIDNHRSECALYVPCVMSSIQLPFNRHHHGAYARILAHIGLEHVNDKQHWMLLLKLNDFCTVAVDRLVVMTTPDEIVNVVVDGCLSSLHSDYCQDSTLTCLEIISDRYHHLTDGVLSKLKNILEHTPERDQRVVINVRKRIKKNRDIAITTLKGGAQRMMDDARAYIKIGEYTHAAVCYSRAIDKYKQVQMLHTRVNDGNDGIVKVKRNIEEMHRHLASVKNVDVLLAALVSDVVEVALTAAKALVRFVDVSVVSRISDILPSLSGVVHEQVQRSLTTINNELEIKRRRETDKSRSEQDKMMYKLKSEEIECRDKLDVTDDSVRAAQLAMYDYDKRLTAFALSVDGDASDERVGRQFDKIRASDGKPSGSKLRSECEKLVKIQNDYLIRLSEIENMKSKLFGLANEAEPSPSSSSSCAPPVITHELSPQLQPQAPILEEQGDICTSDVSLLTQPSASASAPVDDSVLSENYVTRVIHIYHKALHDNKTDVAERAMTLLSNHVIKQLRLSCTRNDDVAIIAQRARAVLTSCFTETIADQIMSDAGIIRSVMTTVVDECERLLFDIVGDDPRHVTSLFQHLNEQIHEAAAAGLPEVFSTAVADYTSIRYKAFVDEHARILKLEALRVVDDCLSDIESDYEDEDEDNRRIAVAM